MEDEWERHIVRRCDKINAHIILVGKPKEKKKLLGRPRRKRESSMKTYFK
jgi:hypothetical protein